jgi:hypothetical protein
MVTWLQERVHAQEDPLLGNDLEHVLLPDAGIHRRDLSPQLREAGGVRVREREVLPQLAGLVVGHAEEFGQSQRLAVRARQQMPGRGLVPGEVALEGERLRSHVRLPSPGSMS